MRRLPWVLGAALVTACAAPQTPTAPAAREAPLGVCREPAPPALAAVDPRRPAEGCGEEERRRALLQAVLSSTAAVTQATPADPEAASLAAAAEAARLGEEGGSASSVRASRRARPDELPEAHDAREAKPTKQLEPPSRLGERLTPERQLEAASCLTAADVAALRAHLSAARRRPADRGELGGWALAQVEAEALFGAVRAELCLRGLTVSPPSQCTTQPLSEVVELQRAWVGPVAAEGSEVERYGRGLARLRAELETRAGLPPSP